MPSARNRSRNAHCHSGGRSSAERSLPIRSDTAELFPFPAPTSKMRPPKPSLQPAHTKAIEQLMLEPARTAKIVITVHTYRS